MTLARTKQNKSVTYQDVLDAPEHLVAEIVNGELITSPRPSHRHGRATLRLGRGLAPFDDPDEGAPTWVILPEPELHLGAAVVVPDLAGWRRERMPELPDGHFVELVPDWVCEVLSPSTQRHDRMRKMPLYGDCGVEWLWLVDPGQEVIEVFHNNASIWSMKTQSIGAGPVHLPPFDAIVLDPGRWFAR